MLRLIIPGTELFDEEKNEFLTIDDVTIDLEHSLISLSKWESKFQKPFLSPGDKSRDELMYYIECMIFSPGVDPAIVSNFESPQINAIQAYIESAQSATTFGEMPSKKVRNEVITSELIYYWMVAFNIPWEAQHWHLNRLFSLIRICNIKNSKPQRMSKQDIAQRNRALNEQRRQQLGTRG